MLTRGERRKAQRFPVVLPLEAKWSGDGEKMQQSGTVQDISASGAYFILSQDPKPASQVELFIRLEIEGASIGGVLLHCLCNVVRTESTAAGRIGVAARIDQYSFLRPSGKESNATPAD